MTAFRIFSPGCRMSPVGRSATYGGPLCASTPCKNRVQCFEMSQANQRGQIGPCAAHGPTADSVTLLNWRLGVRDRGGEPSRAPPGRADRKLKGPASLQTLECLLAGARNLNYLRVR